MTTLRSDRKPRTPKAPRSPLSTKAKTFANLIAGGTSPVVAYRECYPASRRWTGRKAASAAARLGRDPRVIAHLETVLRAKLGKKILGF